MNPCSAGKFCKYQENEKNVITTQRQLCPSLMQCAADAYQYIPHYLWSQVEGGGLPATSSFLFYFPGGSLCPSDHLDWSFAFLRHLANTRGRWWAAKLQGWRFLCPLLSLISKAEVTAALGENSGFHWESNDEMQEWWKRVYRLLLTSQYTPSRSLTTC